ncbi:hypothetical protein KHA80_00130 [Anaerobacillus sp. HL2]|nr:hypothetical protein KHA80_00130 [Anaerobacillus sp. HL2]
MLETASRLENAGHSVSMIYGSMPPETRKKQIEQFINGEKKLLWQQMRSEWPKFADTMDCIFRNEKFDGVKRRRLTSQEVKQIAGRAGRKGFTILEELFLLVILN